MPPAYDSEGGKLYLITTSDEGYPGPLIYVPKGSLDAYRKADGWSYYADRISEYEGELEYDDKGELHIR